MRRQMFRLLALLEGLHGPTHGEPALAMVGAPGVDRPELATMTVVGRQQAFAADVHTRWDTTGAAQPCPAPNPNPAQSLTA